MLTTEEETAKRGEHAVGMGDSVVAIFASHQAAEAGIKELHASGFDMKNLSIAAREYYRDDQIVGVYNVGGRMKAWSQTGSFWACLWGLLAGSALFMTPGLGPLLVAGPLVGWIVGTLEGAVVLGGLSVIGAALYCLGIPGASIDQYETALNEGKFLVIAHGSPPENDLAKAVLELSLPETLLHHV